MQALLLLADGRFPAGGHAHSAGVEAAVADGRVTDVATLAAFAEGRLRTVGLVDAAVAMATATRLAPGDTGSRARAPAPAPVLVLTPTDTAAAEEVHRPAHAIPDDAAAAGHDRRPLALERIAIDADAAAGDMVLGLLDRLDAEVDARTPVPALRSASRRLGRQLLRVAGRCWPSPLLALAARGRDPHQAVAFGLAGVAAALPVADIGALSTHHCLTAPMQAGVRLLGLDPYAVAAATAGLAGVAAAVEAEAATYASGRLADLPARSATLVDIAAVAHATTDARLFVT